MSTRSNCHTMLGRGLLLVLTGSLLFTGCSSSEGPDQPDPSSALATSFPDLAAATGDPTPAAMLTARPVKGQVLQVSGSFDDRFTLKGLGFDGKSVKGSITVTSDVSELLEMQVVAGFHDASGSLLATNRFEHHLDGAHDHGAEEHDHAASPGATPNFFHSEEFTIPVPEQVRGKVVGVTIGVPVLVNE